MLINLHTNPR